MQDDLLENLDKPSAYSGLYAFHKYWGKKPIEPLRFLVEALTQTDDVVVDPFLGSGAIARVASEMGRRVVAGDLNPFAVKLSNFTCNPCSLSAYSTELDRIEKGVRPQIDQSYGTGSTGAVSHILWENGKIKQVWERATKGRRRYERHPEPRDLELASAFSEHSSVDTRPLRLFDNSRINTKTTLGWSDYFSSRALRNIKLLRHSFLAAPADVREALDLTLTASIGQMSKMVFAITGRGKTKGVHSSRIEVGSWIIGYWRPNLHFEINVWNCFESKAKKLKKGLNDLATVFASADIRNCDALELLDSLDDETVDLMITDPPHGDRIPYFELSELWNATLNLTSDLANEIVVSNAKGRDKDNDLYNDRMSELFETASVKLAPGGAIALFFNSRRQNEWQFIRRVSDLANVEFIGSFPMNYSARSVVQDNRTGGLKTDNVMIFCKGALEEEKLSRLRMVPGWADGAPNLEAV